MGYVTMIDRPDKKVELRDDIADQYVVCGACNGEGGWLQCIYYDPSARFGLMYSGNGWVCRWCQGASIVRKRPAAL